MTNDNFPLPRIGFALGSNLGDRLAHLRAAVASMRRYCDVKAVSPVYETPPAYVEDQPSFLNAAVIGYSSLSPLDLLHAMKQLERELGRKISYRNGPRLIDIDIVFYGDRRLHISELELPHPRMAEREFVLRPMADIAGDWLHPETGLSVADMLAALPHMAVPLAEGLI